MPDRAKCTRSTRIIRPAAAPPPPPPPAEPDPDNTVYRATFLWRIAEPEARAALVRSGLYLADCMDEAGQWGEHPDRDIPTRLEAVAEDIEALAAYCLMVARVGSQIELSPEESGLCAASSRWAQRLAHLAVEIRASLGVAWGVC